MTTAATKPDSYRIITADLTHTSNLSLEQALEYTYALGFDNKHVRAKLIRKGRFAVNDGEYNFTIEREPA